MRPTLAALVFVLFPTAAAGESPESLAMVPLQARDLAPARVANLEQLLVSTISELGTHRLIPPAAVKRTLGRTKMLHDDDECVAEIASALPCRYVLTSRVHRAGNRLHLALVMHDTRGGIGGRGRATTKNVRGRLAALVDTAVRDLFDLRPAPESLTKADFVTFWAQLDAKMKDKGIIPEDLPPSTTHLFAEAETAAAIGRWHIATERLQTLHDFIDGVVINPAFIQAKMGRLNRRVQERRLPEHRYPEIERLLTEISEAFANGHMERANRKASELAALIE